MRGFDSGGLILELEVILTNLFACIIDLNLFLSTLGYYGQQILMNFKT
jgi:hypothetical protein